MTRQLFVNLPVKDVKHSRDFFDRLGFKFQEGFSNEFAICLEVNDNAFIMMLDEKYFSKFTKNPVSDAHSHSEVLNAISVESREAVNEIVDRAVSIGAKEARESQEHGFMYGRSFHDLDGHVWEIYWMDTNSKS
ncbi:hypothetical protein Q361_11421 [Flavobacterium croceum DSM 17960]|uniref:VOC domain-containing protein n=1 Tax=Flavobacterium croceum DSM 17960 TaxID=1121886 RepID=A0A2S4N5S1_9FLAO|nr:VOC family protein [Flavobacterium croceum]POS01075.1 hypothetical protein Q361_11421 [Flavobacterium croceum DSM 17960]